MKIRTIKAAGLRGRTPLGGWEHDLDPNMCVHTLIAVHTEDGRVGLGSVFTSDHLVQAALQLLEPLYQGENALEPERVSEKLHQNTFWTGRGGSVTHTISGIDMALWDLLGQATGQPVGRLLGGRYRTKVQPYASLLCDQPEILAERLQAIKARGFRAFKIGWGTFGRVSDALDERTVRAARIAIGDDCQLMVDAGGSNAFWPHGYTWALRTAHMLAAYNVRWFEEPLKPDALDDFIMLRHHTSVSIAGAETLTRRQAFRPWIEGKALDIVQPDVTKVGGISEQRRIAWLAEEHGLRYIGHGWNTAVGLAADLQLASAFPHTDLVEYIYGSPYVDAITKGGIALDDDGFLTIPETPGLGVMLDDDALAQYTGSIDILRP
jgi:D-galactarolactone cycloisomerase